VSRGRVDHAFAGVMIYSLSSMVLHAAIFSWVALFIIAVLMKLEVRHKMSILFLRYFEIALFLPIPQHKI